MDIVAITFALISLVSIVVFVGAVIFGLAEEGGVYADVREEGERLIRARFVNRTYTAEQLAVAAEIHAYTAKQRAQARAAAVKSFVERAPAQGARNTDTDRTAADLAA